MAAFEQKAAESQYPLRRAPSSDMTGPQGWLPLNRVSIPSQAGTLFGPATVGSEPSEGGVSIPSQAGTLFGPWTMRSMISSAWVSIPSQAGTLFGPGMDVRLISHEWVSIPSQAGTLFGPRVSARPGGTWPSLNTLSGGHPLRTPGQRPSLFSPPWSQYPLRRAPSSDSMRVRRSSSRQWSQYPLRRAPSSDSSPGSLSGQACCVSIPSQAGTLFGRLDHGHFRRACQESQYPLRRAPSSDVMLKYDETGGVLVSIPSQAGTLFGQRFQNVGVAHHLALVSSFL